MSEYSRRKRFVISPKWIKLLTTSYCLLTAYCLLPIAHCFAANWGASFGITFTPKPADTTPPGTITDLTVTIDADTNILLKWTAPDEDGTATPSGEAVQKYQIKYATYSVTELSGNIDTWWRLSKEIDTTGLTPQLPGNTESITIKRLPKGYIYYFAIRSVDKANNLSTIDTKSQERTQQFVIIKELLPLKFPKKLDLVLDADKRKTIVEYDPIEYYTDFTSATIVKYKIYWSEDITREKSNWNTYFSSQTQFVDLSPINEIRYYKTIPVDIYANESDFEAALAYDNSDNLNIIATLYRNKKLDAEVKLPKSIHNTLNNYGNTIKISTATKENKNDIAVYNIELTDIMNMKQNKKSANPAPFVEMTEHKVCCSYDQILINSDKRCGVNISLTESVIQFSVYYTDDWLSEHIAIFYHNGIKWLKLGGKVDKTNRKIAVNISQFGKYALRFSIRAEEFVVTPNCKIFTPKGKQPYNQFELLYDNPKGATIVSARIYDIESRFVADLQHDTSGDRFIWTGKYIDGDYVPTGVYIWQIILTGEETKTLNGTVVLVR